MLVRLWTITELRHRWLSLVLLGMLGGLAAGLTMASYDGAERSSTAFQQMRDQLHAADAVIFPSQVRIGDFDPRVLDGLPEVESWGGFSLNSGQLDGYPPYISPFITSGADFFSSIEGAKVLEGRLPDPDRDDEAVITQPGVDQVPSLHVGAKAVWRNLSLDEGIQYDNGRSLPDGFDWTTATGVTTELTIVGVVRLPMESVVAFAADGMLLMGPGWAAAHLDETPLFFTNAFVRLRHGAADLPALRADLERLTGRSDIPVKDLSTDIKRVQRSLDLEHTALLMFAGAIALTALVLIGQAIVRATSSGVSSVSALRAMGASSSALAAGLAAPMLVVIAVTVAVAAAVSVVASRWFPIGLARKVAPAMGMHVQPGREALGLLLTCAVVTAVVGATAVLMQRPAGSRRARRTRLLSVAMRAGASLPSAIGVSLAADAPPDRGARPRLALVAAIVGMVAVIGALTLVHGIDDIGGHPERAGATWDLVVGDVGNTSDEEAFRTIDADSDITDFAIAGRIPTDVGGFDVPVYMLDVHKGSMDFTVVHGRGPQADDEIALGPATMQLLHADIGDTVTLGPELVPVHVVGVALLSEQAHSSFDEGGWVSQGAFSALVGPGSADDLYGQEGFLGLADGVDLGSAISHLPATWQVTPPAVSPDLANLLQVRRLPIYLAIFLGFLAVGAIAHSLFTTARQRARELAVLRTLGLTPRQVAACVSWQALTTGAVAAVAGIPLGVVLGGRVWRSVTDQLSFVYIGSHAGTVLLVAVPACLIGCMILAVVPAREAARRRIADTLRQE